MATEVHRNMKEQASIKCAGLFLMYHLFAELLRREAETSWNKHGKIYIWTYTFFKVVTGLLQFCFLNFAPVKYEI